MATGAFATSIGLTQDQGGIVITALQVGTAIGRPAVGVLIDHLGRMTVASLLTASNVLLTYAIWIPTHSYGLLIFFALVIGATSGIYWGVSLGSPLPGDLYLHVTRRSRLSAPRWLI